MEQLSLRVPIINPSLACCVCGRKGVEMHAYDYYPGGTFELNGKRVPVKAYAFRCVDCEEAGRGLGVEGEGNE